MSLNNFKFVILLVLLITFMTIVSLVFKRGTKQYAKKVVLLLFSYYFIYSFHWSCLVVLALYTLVIYFLAQKVKASKIVLGIGVATSILMLGFFKYVQSLISALSDIDNEDIVISIIVPIGISFYVFSGISYLIDIYKGKYDADKNIINVALFFAFFAKIVSGPIVRYDSFISNFEVDRGIKSEDISVGIQIYVFGLFKKMVLADHLGVFVDNVFYAPNAYNTGTVLFAVLSYSLQIYLDFSGYSDMAIGISRMFGIIIPPNFNLPYIAKGMSDFWKRWHISLSSWFQEYVYYPLGGSKKGNTRTYLNIMIVMLISGVWHGTGITFIVWGVLHGICSCGDHMLEKVLDNKSKVCQYIYVFVTYITVSLLWIVFRADNVMVLKRVFIALFTAHSGISQPYTWSFFAMGCVLAATVVAIIKSKKEKLSIIIGFYPVMDLRKVSSLTLFLVFCGMTILLGYYGNTAFIYGRF